MNTQEKIAQLLTELAALTRQNCTENENFREDKDNWYRLLKFTDKEILKMPKTFRKEFRAQGCTAHVRKRKSGKNNCNYEIRYRRNGYNIAVSSNNLEKAKQKFIDCLNTIDKFGNSKPKAIPNQFDEFAIYYFDKFWRRKVTELTYKNSINRYNNHIKPFIGNYKVQYITPDMCQQIIDRLIDKGYGKTADEVFSILNTVFKMAIKYCLIKSNPMDIVIHRQHDKQHGKALTKAEEKLLLDNLKGTKYELLIAVALYTGLRPNEFKTAKIESEFIVAVNSKRKTKKVEYKKIPITPMLRPYLENVTSLSFPGIQYIRDQIKAILPNHKLYDLRTTFYTRCQECGISDVARNEFVGHSLGALGDTYTDLSDEFLINEGMKFNY